MCSQGLYIGVGTVTGRVLVLNLKNEDFESKGQRHEEMIKALDFSTDSRYIYSGNPMSMAVDVMPIIRTEGNEKIFNFL